MDITIIGAGAIGGVIGAHLVRAGYTVEFCDKVEEHVRFIRDEALTIEGPTETFQVRAPAYTPDQLVRRGEQLQAVLMCVKAQDTEPALRQILNLVGPETYVVSCQNGLCENIIASLVGRERTIGCFVNFSADYLGPGQILYGGPSAFYIGELSGEISPRVTELQAILSTWGPVEVTDNIWGYLWGKLSYAALLFATALVDETMAVVVRSRKHRPALLELCAEILEVADRLGIVPVAFDDWAPDLVYPRNTVVPAGRSHILRPCSDSASHNSRRAQYMTPPRARPASAKSTLRSASFHPADGAARGMEIDPRENRDLAALDAQWERLAQRMASNKKTKSGIWRDLVVRKRKTEVDYQLTPVVNIGESYGLELPLVRFVIERIKALETGDIAMGWSHLDELLARFEQASQRRV
ncbi:MAG: ketopantoate reductase family protein [Bacilli bacterium]